MAELAAAAEHARDEATKVRAQATQLTMGHLTQLKDLTDQIETIPQKLWTADAANTDLSTALSSDFSRTREPPRA